MRILVATMHRGIVGGVETYLRALLPELVKRGHDVGVLYEYSALPNEPTIHDGCQDIPVWSLPDLGAALAWKPSVCYQHGLFDTTCEQKLAEHFPSVLYSHNYQGTCISGTKCHARPAYQPCQRSLGVGCLALYFPRRCGGLNPVKMIQLYRNQRERQRTLTHHNAVLVASRRMSTEMVRNGVAPELVHLVALFPPNTEPDVLTPTPKQRSNRILFLGRITALKGWTHLLSAIPRAAELLNKKLTLVVAGDGPDRTAFENEARSRGVGVEFLEWIGADSREAEMRAADILIVPSVWPEPFGLVGIEAGCVGLPAVAYAVGGIPDWLEPGVSGELAPGERPDPEQLAAAIIRAIADESHWQQLRIGAWESAKRFTRSRHLEQLEAILNTVTRSKL